MGSQSRSAKAEPPTQQGSIKDLLRPLLTVLLFPFAIFLSICSLLLAYLRDYFWIYQDTPISTTSERETAYIQAQAHTTDAPGRTKRRTWHCSTTGSLGNMKLRDEFLDPPNPGYVQVKVHAIGLNFADIFAVQGLYSATPPYPFTPGLEFSGEISCLPAGATLAQRTVNGQVLNVGDKVHGVTRFGAYSTIINANVLCIKLLPPNWSYVDGASNLVQSLTAAYALYTLGGLSSIGLTQNQIKYYSSTHNNTGIDFGPQIVPNASDTSSNAPQLPHHPAYLPHLKQISPHHSIPMKRPIVLIHSAAGGVGLHALAMCLKTGAIPICTVSGHKKRAYLVNRFKLLPEQVIDRSLCGHLLVQHIPTPPQHNNLFSHLKYYAKSLIRMIFKPIRNVIDRTIFFRRKQSKDYSFLLDYALKMIWKRIYEPKPSQSQSQSLQSTQNNSSTASLPPLALPTTSSESTKPNETLPPQQLTIDMALDSLLGNWFNPTFQHMGCNNSKVVIFGAASYSSSGDYPDFIHLCNEYFHRPIIDPMEMIPLNSGIFGFNLIWLWDQLHELHGLLHILDQLLPYPVANITCFGTSKVNSPDIISDLLNKQNNNATNVENFTMYDIRDKDAVSFKFPGVNGFDYLHEALKSLQTGQNIGKIVVSVSHDD